MNVLFDTDVLIDVALNREPFVEASAKVVDAAERKLFRAFIAWHSISNFYYIVTSASKESDARSFIRELLQFVSISSTTRETSMYALNLKMPDLEDAMQAAAAHSCNAERIITRNIRHYKKSPILAQAPGEFLQEFSF